MEASYVDLADARHLEFDYLRRMHDLVEAAGARRVIHVGGAGCARAAADRSPGAVLAPEEMPAFVGGVPPWRDVFPSGDT